MSSPHPYPEADPAASDHGDGLPRLAPSGDPIARLGDLADRLGTSIPMLVVGALIVAAALGVGAVALLGPDAPAAELTIPYVSTTSEPTDSTAATADGGTAASTDEMFVHAAGAVRHPGVYAMSPGARVSDLLAAAGGVQSDADIDRVNLAAPLADGSRVYVPAVGQEHAPPVVAGEGPAPSSGTGADPGRAVDLNSATAAELEALPGIGPATAASIIEHRERNGPFANVDELLDVRGIGDAKLAALRDLVHV